MSLAVIIILLRTFAEIPLSRRTLSKHAWTDQLTRESLRTDAGSS
jgi:hypothetical protein